MEYFIKNMLALALITLLSDTINAQNLYTIKNEKDFNRHFSNEILKYNDTLSETKQTGLVFIKFSIKNDGLIEGIKFSEKQPSVLIHILTKILSQFKIDDTSKSWSKTATYVLPVSYNYVPELTLPITAEKLLNQIPHINPDSLISYINFDFNGFFREEESQRDLWGIKCVLLPMIKISRPVVYHYGIKEDKKENLKKPRYPLTNNY